MRTICLSLLLASAALANPERLTIFHFDDEVNEVEIPRPRLRLEPTREGKAWRWILLLEGRLVPPPTPPPSDEETRP